MVNYTTVEQVLLDKDFMFALIELRDVDEVVSFCKENELEVDVDLLLKVRELFVSDYDSENGNESLALTSLDEVAGGVGEFVKGVNDLEATDQIMQGLDSIILNINFMTHGHPTQQQMQQMPQMQQMQQMQHLQHLLQMQQMQQMPRVPAGK